MANHEDTADPRIGEPYRPPDEERSRRSKALRTSILIGSALFAAFWVWALFFASKAGVNRIEDRAWAERAESICAEVKPRVRLLELKADPDITVRADLVVESTDMLSVMLDDITVTPPTDAKGQAIIPDWIDEYRILLNDRYTYADRLRNGENVPFTETPVNGVPITERIETFANDNEMPSCAPPRGSVV